MKTLLSLLIIVLSPGPLWAETNQAAPARKDTGVVADQIVPSFKPSKGKLVGKDAFAFQKCQSQYNPIPPTLQPFFSDAYCCAVKMTAARLSCLQDTEKGVQAFRNHLQTVYNSLPSSGGYGSDSLIGCPGTDYDASQIDQAVSQIECEFYKYSQIVDRFKK